MVLRCQQKKGVKSRQPKWGQCRWLTPPIICHGCHGRFVDDLRFRLDKIHGFSMAPNGLLIFGRVFQRRELETQR